MIPFSLEDCPWTPSGHDREIRRQVLVGRGKMPGLAQFGRFRLEPGQSVSAHAHPDLWELFQVVAGDVVFSVDGREILRGTGEGLVIQPGEVHALANRGSQAVECLIVGIEGPPRDETVTASFPPGG